jgi:hypothetical protein
LVECGTVEVAMLPVLLVGRATLPA